MAGKSTKFRRLQMVSLIETILILILLILLVWALFIRKPSGESVPANAGYSDEPQVRTRAVIEKEETFYQNDGKKILYQDGAYGEVFIPAFADVPVCSLDMDSLVTRNGYSFYKQDGAVTSVSGIDVSEFQGDIDWQQVKDAGIEFAMIRVGYRSYGGGEVKYDKNFEKYLDGASAVGIKTGVYFFSQAVNADEAAEEADAVLDAIAPYDITYPVVFDWELITEDNARTDEMSVEMLADCCVTFCERIKAAGYTPMIYQNKSTTMRKLDLPRVKDYDFWLAEYDTKPTYYYDFAMWQYSATGSVPGISGDVDMDIAFHPYG